MHSTEEMASTALECFLVTKFSMVAKTSSKKKKRKVQKRRKKKPVSWYKSRVRLRLQFADKSVMSNGLPWWDDTMRGLFFLPSSSSLSLILPPSLSLSLSPSLSLLLPLSSPLSAAERSDPSAGPYLSRPSPSSDRPRKLSFDHAPISPPLELVVHPVSRRISVMMRQGSAVNTDLRFFSYFFLCVSSCSFRLCSISK